MLTNIVIVFKWKIPDEGNFVRNAEGLLIFFEGMQLIVSLSIHMQLSNELNYCHFFNL